MSGSQPPDPELPTNGAPLAQRHRDASAVSGGMPAARQMRYQVLLTGVLPTLAMTLYATAVGVRNVTAFLVLIAIAVVIIGAVFAALSGPTDSDDRRHVQLLGTSVSPVVLYAFAVHVLDGPVAPLSLVIAVLLIAVAYTLPRRLRLPLQLWIVAGWLAVLWSVGIRSPSTWVLHTLGALAVMLLATDAADRQALGQVAAERNRQEADALARILASVLRVNSLEPRSVLRAVTEGLHDLGFAIVEIRRIDADADAAKLMAGVSSLDEPLQEEIPAYGGLLGHVFEDGEPIVLDRFDDDPRVQDRGRGFQGTMMIPLTLGGGARGVLTAVSMTGPLTRLQREAVEVLVDHAAVALRRATQYESDALIVDDLRRLDERTQDFVSTASHELRTPLTVITGLGQTLRRHWSELDAGRREDLLQRIEANADRLSVMVNSLLDTSALERGELQPTLVALPLRATVLRLLDRLATVTAAHPVSLDVPDDLEVLVDAALFEHVIENLLTNVAKHTPQGTSVTVRARRLDENVEVQVIDQGPGIDAHDLPHVLDRFYRGGAPTRRSTGGLGLGLALAQQIVRAHGSELKVESAPGQGTTFGFTVRSA